MKKLNTLIACFLVFTTTMLGQTEKFTVEVSNDSILLGNTIEVSFIIENADGRTFTNPNFEGFDIISGPNSSSSFSMINGETTRSFTYSYFLQPKDVGTYYIEPASIEVDGKFLETKPVELLVVPNPDGIIQKPNRKNEFNFDFRSPGDFFKEDRKEIEPKKKAKKKRKTYRI